MKKLVLLWIISLSVSFGYAQPTKDTLPSYVKNNGIPAFNLLTVDSIPFVKQDLPKNKFTVFIYFSPNCSHCKAKAKALADNIDSVSNAYFVWASYHPLDSLKKFVNEFGLQKFNNVKVCRDTKFFIPVYFKATVTPYIAVYDKNGHFYKEFREGTLFKDVIAALREK